MDSQLVPLAPPCAAGPRIVKPPTTTETVTEILTVKIVLIQTLEITRICALLTWKEVKPPLAISRLELSAFLVTRIEMEERVQSIATDWHGLTMLMILLRGTRAITSSSFPCMTTCISVDTLRMFLVLPCVDASSKCPPSLALTVPRLTPPRGSRSLTIALPMRLKDASPSSILTSMHAKVSITVTTISGLTWAVSSTKARSRTLSGVRLVASSPIATVTTLWRKPLAKKLWNLVMITMLVSGQISLVVTTSM
mmetsp:Transcript_26013/g.52231  ORF Transcript_26013/g.52231 Transcript_26013/m.52231 type:complete len:253 (+) Transcript_26013:680-1438(+)